jgi:P-type Cu2+ transporter
MNAPVIDATAAEQVAGCYHCGLPVPAHAGWPVVIDRVARSMCCPGCQAVAQTIVDSGLTDYYRDRTSFSGNAGPDGLVPPELQLYDMPETASQFGAACADDAAVSETTLSVEGIRCAACVWLIERHVSRLPGVQAASMNVATERLHVRWSSDACKPSTILNALHAIGYSAYPFDVVKHEEQLRRAGKILFRRTFVAGLSMMQVMMYAVPAYIATDGTLDADMAMLMQWASLLLTLPAVLYSAVPFFRGAWADIRRRAPGMDVPVALGIAAAFGASVIATLRGSGEVYFDSVTMFVFLLLCSRYLELVARRKAASALEKLQRALPASASLVPDYPERRDVELVPVARLRAGDVILVRPGDAIAADGVILEGATAIDMSLLTGESNPVRRAAGEPVPGGAVNAAQAVMLRLTRAAGDSTLSSLVKLVERAGQAKPQLALWADRVAAWFVSALLLFAVAIFAIWYWHDAARAWPIAIAVLVVSCPCALSLATPSALAAATDRLVREGVLVVQPHVLETLHRTTHVIFDKTGTLTVGKPVLEHVETFGALERGACVALAALLEAGNAHPLGAAIVDAAKAAGRTADAIQASEVQYRVGQGIEATVDGRRYRIGNPAFVAELAGLRTPVTADGDMTSVYLGGQGTWLARFDIRDQLRSGAAEVVAFFREAGKTVVLLSGDSSQVVSRVATGLGIAQAYGEQLPDDKLAFVQKLQAEGAVVAMVGDGINDAAVLRAADVSFAMGSGAALAQTHADTVLLSGDIAAVRQAALVARQTMAVIRQNLGWATLYNAIAIPAAALGWLNPWMAGIGMASSSAVVVINALRLRGRARPSAASSIDSAAGRHLRRC